MVQGWRYRRDVVEIMITDLVHDLSRPVRDAVPQASCVRIAPVVQLPEGVVLDLVVNDANNLPIHATAVRCLVVKHTTEQLIPANATRATY